RTEEREVQVPVGRPAEGVAAAVAPGVARLAELARVVPTVVRTRLARRRDLARHIDRLLTTLLVEGGVVATDRERRARDDRADAVDLPVLDDLGEGARGLTRERQFV